MNFDKKDVDYTSDQLDFVNCEEYDLVSSHDLSLMSDRSLESNFNQNGDINNKHYSSIKHYEEEWNELHGVQELDIEKLKQKSVQGLLRTSRFRSVCWRCLLGILHKQPKQWLCQLETYRKHYNEVSTELEKNPWNVKENNPSDNPLSQESESIWQKYFCDEELKAIIHQDVKRTFPDVDFFKKEYIQQIMVKILFCYARQNPALCYRQGMHEILAPIIFLLHCDHQAFLHAKENSLSLDNAMFEILNPDYLEQDAFSIFKYIMNHIECSYRINNMVTTSAGNFPIGDMQYDNINCQNEVITRLDYIKKNILQQKDAELKEHLEKFDIPFHLFGIRWLRLLFGREFPLQDLLVLWDFIFANGFETVNYIVVAMLVAIRELLLAGDYTACLSSLMRYPNGIDITYIIEYSLHLMNPQKYLAPDPMRVISLSQDKNKVSKQQSAENQEAYSQINRRLKRGSSLLSHRFLGKSRSLLLGQNGEGDGAIVSSYTVNDPNILKAELEKDHIIMNEVHHKLVEFYAILVKNLQNNNNTEVQLVIDGIHELSCQLKNHIKETNLEIETACEAGEIKEPKKQIPIQPSLDRLKPTTGSINSDRRSHTLPKMKRNHRAGELKVFKQEIGGFMKGGPMVDPLHSIKNLNNENHLDSANKSE